MPFVPQSFRSPHPLARRMTFSNFRAGGGVLLIAMVIVCIVLGLQGCSAWNAAFDPKTGEPTPQTQTLTGSAIGLLSAINPILGVVATGLVGTATAVAVAKAKQANRVEAQSGAIVDSIDTAYEKHPEFKAAMDGAAETIRKVQEAVPGTQALVDKVQETREVRTV